MPIQNYYVQITITKGRIIEDGADTLKRQDSVELDQVFCKPTEEDLTAFIESLNLAEKMSEIE